MYLKTQVKSSQARYNKSSIGKEWSRYLLYMFLILYPITEGFSNDSFPIGNLFVVALLVFLWIIETLRDRRLFITHSSIVLFALSFWTIASFFWSTDQDKTISRIMSLIPIVLVYLIIIDLVRSVAALHRFLYSYCIGAIILALTAVFNIINGVRYEGLYNRFSAIGYDPNNFGIFIMSSVPLFDYLIQTSKPNSLWYSWAYYIFCLSLALSTGSRGAIICGAIVSLYMLFLRINILKNSKLIIKNMILMLMAIYSLYFLTQYFIPPEALERFSNQIVSSADDSRASIWQESYTLWNNHWLIGIGANTTSSNTVSDTQAHNTFISSFSELGLIGGTLWLIAWIAHIIYAIRIYKTRPNLSISLTIAIACVMIGALTLNWEARKPLYIVWAAAASSISIYRRREGYVFDDELAI
ncbi:O-antigen ligase [Deinococcus sp. AJ005]|uniref:O-antigen ligase family protein n=1 Tax=Deinococcus sp. AJ005 TaxID=2652443 RepID=UPI00125CB7B8|nr:O-antigen ligase family protein [Deinococcus sp. AJ005]QFP75893.1 O-antigen ligase family protein [Deinococcus sp. AJ005]